MVYALVVVDFTHACRKDTVSPPTDLQQTTGTTTPATPILTGTSLSAPLNLLFYTHSPNESGIIPSSHGNTRTTPSPVTCSRFLNSPRWVVNI